MIPKELKDGVRWCVWKREYRDGKPTKIPYNPATGAKAESNNPETFSGFDLAEEQFKYLGEYDGVGMLVCNNFAAIDIDHCVTDGELSDFAKEICETMQCYTEFSPSKTGLRIIFTAPGLNYDKSKYYIKNPNNGVEIYVAGMTNRFVTITGNTIFNYPIREAIQPLQTVLDKYMQRSKKSTAVNTKLTDEQIISKASQNEKFCSLFNGDMSAYNNDHSSADLALCNMLAFWTQKDARQIDSIFRQSKLYRPEKWGERDDYSQATIEKAINSCSEVYSPAHARKIWDRLDTPLMNIGEWAVDNSGISRLNNKKQAEYATSTPISPAAYLENYDEGVHKVELHYLYNNVQRSIVCERETIASKSKIVSLANYGVNVTSNTASALVQYFADIERLNGHSIPHYKSVSRVGWVGNDFVPYTQDIRFDGEAENRPLYQAISQQGDYDEWVKFITPLRKNKYLRLMLAASFASPLIERVNALPFVFHLWGETGKGKTVALMIAMSIWGDPRAGKLTRTMNMTNAAMMSTTAFLYNLPFAGDELQTIKDTHTSYDKLIMQITEGIERGRMSYNKNLPTRHWRNAFLFTGEERCTNDKSGGGTKNRVFEVEFRDTVVDNGPAAVRFINHNYGHAGRKFIDYVSKLDNETLSSTYDSLVQRVLKLCDTTDKQAAVAGLILLGDKLACDCIFMQDIPLSPEDVIEFVKTNKEVVVSNRAYDFIVNWITKNNDKFTGTSYGEVWGRNGSKNSVYVLDDILVNALETTGFSYDAVKKDWAEQGWLVKYQNKFKKRYRINGVLAYCVEIRLPDEQEVVER